MVSNICLKSHQANNKIKTINMCYLCDQIHLHPYILYPQASPECFKPSTKYFLPWKESVYGKSAHRLCIATKLDLQNTLRMTAVKLSYKQVYHIYLPHEIPLHLLFILFTLYSMFLFEVLESTEKNYQIKIQVTFVTKHDWKHLMKKSIVTATYSMYSLSSRSSPLCFCLIFWPVCVNNFLPTSTE